MKIGLYSSVSTSANVDAVVKEIGRSADAGLSSYWAAMLTGQDTLTTLAVAGTKVPNIELATGVVPIPLRTPFALAQQVATIQHVTGRRFALGVGTSHEAFVRDHFGGEWDRPVQRAREYIIALRDVLDRAAAGEYPFPLAPVPQVLLGAVNPQMVAAAVELADGLVTWAAGVVTLQEVIGTALSGRVAPFRVVVGLPLCVTDNTSEARERITRLMGAHDGHPSYQKVFRREGAGGLADVSLVGSEAELAERISELEDAGATDFTPHVVVGSQGERTRTWEFLAQLATDAAR